MGRHIRENRSKKFNPIRARLRYLCAYLFAGNVRTFALRTAFNQTELRQTLSGDYSPHISFLIRLVRDGLVNAEWLLCGTGEPFTKRSANELSPLLAEQFTSRYPVYDTTNSQYQIVAAEPFVLEKTGAASQNELATARAIYQARTHKKPVLLFLGETAVLGGGSRIAAEMVRKGYLTSLAFSTAGAMRDLELALFGGFTPGGRLAELRDMNGAAVLAAESGIGYGEALGRWIYPKMANRKDSALLTAYEMALPVTVHLALGDSETHFYPAVRAAELGAALGAASYVDLLVFTQQLAQFGGQPGGVFISADDGAQSTALFKNARAALVSDERTKVNDYTLCSIYGDYRLTLPALLHACDAVYDGSADDDRRRRSGSVGRNR